MLIKWKRKMGERGGKEKKAKIMGVWEKERKKYEISQDFVKNRKREDENENETEGERDTGRKKRDTSLFLSLDSPSFVWQHFWCTMPRHIYLRRSSGILPPNPHGHVSFLNLPLLCQHLFCNSLAATLSFRPRLEWQISAAPTTHGQPPGG